MGMAFVETQAAEVLPPFYGQVAAVNVAATATVIDLCSFPKSAATPGEQPTKNPIGAMIRITADGGAVYFTTGANFAQLNAISNVTTYSTVNATTGKVTFAGQELDVIPNGAWKDFRAMPGLSQFATPSPPGSGSPCRYVALIAPTSTVARIYQSSR